MSDMSPQAAVASIAAKQSAKQASNAPAQADHDPQVVEMLQQEIKAAQEAGNPGLSIALKQTLKRYLSAPYPANLK